MGDRERGSTATRDRVLAWLAEHRVMTLATVSARGPWAAAVFYANDGLRLYFLSSPSSRHVADLTADPRVAATIHRDVGDWSAIRGLQIAGTARAVAPEDEDRVRALYERRHPIVGSGAGTPPAILEALTKVRWYEVAPEHIRLIDNTAGFAHRERLDCVDD